MERAKTRMSMHPGIHVLSATLILALALSAQEPTDSQGWLNLGVQLFKNGKFQEATHPLQMALQLDPSSGPARVLLSHQFMRLHHVSARTPLDYGVVKPARQSIAKALDADPKNAGALHAMASVSMTEESWKDAQQSYEKLVAADPKDACALYGLAHVAIQPWWPAYNQALKGQGMSREDPGGHTGPFRDPVRTALKSRFGVPFDQAIANVQRALAINPQFSDAMAMMFSLLNARAYLLNTPEEFRRQKMEAHQWLLKSSEARRQAGKPRG